MNVRRTLDVTIPKSLHYSSSSNNICDSGNNKNSNNNNNIVTSATYYHFPQNTNADVFLYSTDNCLTSEETLLLERSTTKSANSTTMGLLIHKSNSYNDGTMVKPKSTIIKQDCFNGRFNTSVQDNESDYRGVIMVPKTSCSTPTFCTQLNITVSCTENERSEDRDAFLKETNGTSTVATATVCSNNRRHQRSNSKSQRYAICYRIHAFVTHNSYLNYLVPMSILISLMVAAYLTRDYAKRLLYWIELQNPWTIFAIFMVLFVIVSFPIVVGYFVLMITAGYLFGCIKGLLTVIVGANMGIAVAHLTLRSLRHRIPIQKIIKNETGRAILRVISGPRAFRVVLFTRLTPIPFGLQNAIFGISSINSRIYHIATFFGLLPAQMINVYLGSTLRSMHEVLSNHGSALTGYISFGIEVICGIALMCWVVQKARKELSNTLLTDISNEGKLIDIQV